MVGEVQVYDYYICGDVYGFVIEKDGEQIDSCWGFYGHDYGKSGMLDYLGEYSHILAS